VRRRGAPVTWSLDEGPVFANCVGLLDFNGSDATLLVEQARPYDAEGDPSLEPIFTRDLRSGASVKGPAAAGA
jgi:hypothetical protein